MAFKEYSDMKAVNTDPENIVEIFLREEKAREGETVWETKTSTRLHVSVAQLSTMVIYSSAVSLSIMR